MKFKKLSLLPDSIHSIVREYVFYVFLKIQKTRLFTFFEVSCQKNVKNVESVFQLLTFLHFKIANEHFHCKTVTHVMLYIEHYIKTVHFLLKHNGLAIVRKTTKLIEGGQHGLQDYRPICYYFYVFFYVFYVFFFKIQKVVTFTFFCRVSYVFSNYDSLTIAASLIPLTKTNLPIKTPQPTGR